VSEAYEQNRFCIDSDCGGIAEPEEELAEGGLLRWWTCRGCGMEFGYELVKDEAAAGGCSLGIPAAVRAAASVLVPDEPARVFLGSTIGRRPE
jgi:hypothetical protein